MNLKQERFCEEYIKDFNATKASIRSGYSVKSANACGKKHMKHPEIRARIQELMDGLRKDSIATADEVMQYLTAVMRGEVTDTVLKLVGDGMQEAIEIPSSTKDRNKAAELLGKRYGLFTEKVNVESAIPVVIQGADELE